MPLPRYSLDDGADDGDEESFEDSYASHNNNNSNHIRVNVGSAAASSSRLPTGSSSLPGAGDSNAFSQQSSFPSDIAGLGGRSGSPSYSTTYDAAPSSLDIDALLESAQPASATTASKSNASSGSAVAGWPYSSTSPVARLTPFEQLTLFMATQKAAPELLPFPITSFELLVSQMEQQQSILDSLLHLAQPSNGGSDQHQGGEAEAEEGGGVDEDEYLRLNLVQVDLERCKWLLKHIVRSRMDLLQRYAGFVSGRQNEKAKLNATETHFVNQYWQLKKDLFQSTVLGFLPEQLHDLTSGQPTSNEDDSYTQQEQQQQQQANNSNNMVPGPDLEAPVFVRCLEDCGSISLPDGETATLSNESVHLLRYRSIRHLVYQGSVTLL